MGYSNRDIKTARDDSHPVVGINPFDPESLGVVRAEHVVQDRIHVDDNIVFLGGFDQFEELVLGPILCTGG